MINIQPNFPYIIRGKENFLTSMYGKEIGEQYVSLIDNVTFPVSCGGVDDIPKLHQLALKQGYKTLAEGLTNYVSYRTSMLHNLPQVDNVKVIYH